MSTTHLLLVILSLLSLIVFLYINDRMHKYHWTHPASKATGPAARSLFIGFFLFVLGFLAGNTQQWSAGWEFPVFVSGFIATILFALVFFMHRRWPIFLVNIGDFSRWSLVLVPLAFLGIFAGAWFVNVFGVLF